jgi:hypothetical protein
LGEHYKEKDPPLRLLEEIASVMASPNKTVGHIFFKEADLYMDEDLGSMTWQVEEFLYKLENRTSSSGSHSYLRGLWDTESCIQVTC